MGTSALRDSKNGQEFVNEAKKLTDIDVNIISWRRGIKSWIHGCFRRYRWK